MKYHATLSTIVISIIVLLLFMSVAVFTVFSLNILSPGYMVSDYLLSKIPVLDPYELSYDKLTNLHNGITVENIDISFNDNRIIHLDKVKVSASAFQLIKGYLDKDMALDVRVQGLDVDIPFDIKDFVLPTILQSKDGEEKGSEKTKEPFSLSLKVSGDDANIRYMDLFDLTGITFNVALAPGFKITDAKVQVDKLLAKYNEIVGETEDFRLDLKCGKRIDIVLSVDKLNAKERFDIDLSALSLATSLKSFKDIDILSLPLSLSLKEANLKGDDISLVANDISVSYQDKVASLYLGKLEGDHLDYSVSTEKLPLTLELKEDSLDLSSKNSLILGFENTPLVKVGELQAAVSNRDDEYLFMISKLELDAIDVDKNLSEYLENVSVGNVNMVVRYDAEKQILLDGGIDVNITTVFDSIKNINIPLSITTEIDDEFKVRAASIYTLSGELFKGEEFKVNFDLTDYDDMAFSAQKGNELKLNGSFGSELKFRLEANNYGISRYSELIKAFVPALQSYIGDGTSFTSVIDFQYERESEEGDADALITLSDIKFNKNEFSLSTNLDAHIASNIIELKRLVLTSSFLRAEYKGLLDMKALKPQGVLTLALPDSETPLLELSFSPEGDNSYSYIGTIPYLETGSMKGEVSYYDDRVFTLFDLNFKNRSYPFNVNWNFKDKYISVISDTLKAKADYRDLLIDIGVSILDFPVGTKTELPDTLINGDFNFTFDIPKQKFEFSLPDLEVGKFHVLENEPSLYISLFGDNESIEFKRFDFISPFDSFIGHGRYLFEDKTAAFTIGDNESSIDVTFSPFEQYYTGIIDINELNLGAIGFKEQRLSATLIGRGKDLNNFEFSGNVDISPVEGAATHWTLTSSILINKDQISLANFKYDKGALSLTDTTLLLDINRGKYELGSKIDLTFNSEAKIKEILTEFKLSAQLGTFDSWFNAVRTLTTRYKEGDIATSLTIPYLIVDKEVVATDRNVVIEKNVDSISLLGNMIKGDVSLIDYTGAIDLFGLENLISAKIDGVFDPSDVDLEVNIEKFDLYYLNAFFYSEVFKFLPDSVTYGSVKVLGNLLEKDFHLFGDVFGYEVGMDVWWVTKQDIYLAHPTFHIWDNLITSASLPIITVDRETKEKRVHTGTLELSMQNSFMDYFTLDIYSDEDNLVYVRVPVVSANVDAGFWTYGHYRYQINELGRIMMSGDLTLNDGQASIGMEPLPEWWNSTKKVINDYNITIGKNVRFIFPLSSSPILSADLKPDTTISFYNNMFTNQTKVSGQVLIKSGQIYYFSKSFFITEGAIDLVETNGKLNPKLSLRARLRDFDSNNEKIDIYLVLNNSTLENINPSFESSPQKTNNEIMAILGNAILPTDTGVGNFNTVASLVTSSVDILSRLGLMANQGGDLNQSIKNALHLDMFSINSQIIENFLLDSVASNRTSTTSALSRYLNNTSIYLGKYLSDNFFLQGIIHFASVSNNKSANFFASDLAINTELSLEWTNPLGIVTFFTHPEALTIYDTVRNFGITYTKRLTL